MKASSTKRARRRERNDSLTGCYCCLKAIRNRPGVEDHRLRSRTRSRSSRFEHVCSVHDCLPDCCASLRTTRRCCGQHHSRWSDQCRRQGEEHHRDVYVKMSWKNVLLSGLSPPSWVPTRPLEAGRGKEGKGEEEMVVVRGEAEAACRCALPATSAFQAQVPSLPLSAVIR